MDSTRLAEIDRALASLGVPDARTAEILARYGVSGRALADVDAELGQLAEGVALPVSAPLDLEVATASTRDLGSPDEMITEALTADLQRPAPSSDDAALADDEPELTASPIAEEPTPAPPPRSPAATPSSSGSLQLDELFDDPALTTDFVSPPEEALAAAATAAPTEVEEVGPDVHVSPDLAALLEGEIDPSEFDGKPDAAAAAAPVSSPEEESPARVSVVSEDLASMLEPDADAVDIDVSEVEILEDDDGLPPDLSDDQTVIGAPPDELPATPPSEPPPEEKKGFLRKMFGK